MPDGLRATADGGRAILLLSFAFPPTASAEGPLSAKSFAGFSHGPVDVISAAPLHPSERQDDSLADYVAAGFRAVHRLPAPSVWKRRLYGKVPGFRNAPDIHRVFVGPAVREAERLGVGSYAAVVTWSQWHSAHLAGLALKRRHPRLPWIAHLSDPWIGNPYDQRTPFAERQNQRLQDKVFAAADAIVFTTDSIQQSSLSGYSPALRRKSHVIPHPFDPALYGTGADEPAAAERPLAFTYLGAFYGLRRPDPVLQGLRELLDRRPALRGRIALRFIGSSQFPLDDAVAAAGLPPGTVEVLPPTDYRTSLRLMRASDVLMVIDAPFAQSPFLPSKLVDYLGARKPILGVTPPGESRDLIQRCGYPTADPRDVAAVAEAIGDLADRVIAERSGSAEADAAPQAKVYRAYHIDMIQASYAALVAELNRGRAR
jgi:hypothetical protein